MLGMINTHINICCTSFKYSDVCQTEHVFHKIFYLLGALMLSVGYMLPFLADLGQGVLSDVLKSQMTWELRRGAFLSQAGCCLESMGLGEGVLC